MIDNPFDATREAVRRAGTMLRAVDGIADAMVSLLIGRLRHVSRANLVALKRELRSFDAQRKVWK